MTPDGRSATFVSFGANAGYLKGNGNYNQPIECLFTAGLKLLNLTKRHMAYGRSYAPTGHPAAFGRVSRDLAVWHLTLFANLRLCANGTWLKIIRQISI